MNGGEIIAVMFSAMWLAMMIKSIILISVPNGTFHIISMLKYLKMKDEIYELKDEDLSFI